MVGTIAALGIWMIVVLVGAALTRPRAAGRKLAIVFALAALPAAFMVPPESIVGRFTLALLLALALGRSLDLALRDHSLSYWGRVWMFVALFDVRHARRGPAGLDVHELGWLLGHAGVLVLGWLGVFEWAPQFVGARFWLIRWLGGLLLCYGLFEAGHSALLMGYRVLGIHHIRINDRPIVSTTLVEFWGRRWNRVVAGWLRDYTFLPLARRGHVWLAIAAAFTASTALHFWTSWVPLGWIAGLTMGSFFVVHGVALVIERKLAIARWPVGVRRAWTAAILVGSSPLFVEPILRVLTAFADLAAGFTN